MKIPRLALNTVLSCVVLMGGMFASNKGFALTCSEVRQLTLLYFKMHYSYDKFDDVLSERTLENFIKAWDPGKLYFFDADVKEFRDKYKDKLDDMINKLDCSAIDFMFNRYSKRFQDRQVYQMSLVDKTFDFTKDEYLDLERKTTKFPQTLEEVNDRWRKRVKFQLLSLKSTISLKEAREKVKKRLELGVKRHNELTRDKVYSSFLNAFSLALDPHTSYMPAEDLEDFRIRTRLSLEGIGASLKSEDGFTIVASLVKGGAAEKSGLLKVNDKIIAVAQEKGDPVDVIAMDLQDVVRLIRGARGTKVILTVVREGAGARTMQIPIVREKIQLVDQQASSRMIELVDKNDSKNKMRIGVINLPSFYVDFEGQHKNLQNYRSSSKDTIRELSKLQAGGLDGLIIDLRNNGGGSLDESIKLAGLFFDRGPVVQVKAPNGETEAYLDKDGKTFYDGELVVMINRHSASASEIFAGAIKDYSLGLIVGDSHTFGKGTVQNLNDVAPTLGAIKVTVSQFYRPDGATTQLRGVESDIRLPTILDELDVGEKFYDYALPFETIKAAPHERFNRVAPYLKAVKQRSHARVASEPGFQEIFDNIEKYKKNKDERSRISLKDKSPKELAEEQKEKQEEEAREKSMRDDDDKFHLKDDVYLQEAAKIAADSVRLKRKQKLVSWTIPELEIAKASQKKVVKETSKK